MCESHTREEVCFPSLFDANLGVNVTDTINGKECKGR